MAILKIKGVDGRNCSVVVITTSEEDPGSIPQGSFSPSIQAVTHLKDPIHSCTHQACTWYTYIPASQTLIHKKIKDG